MMTGLPPPLLNTRHALAWPPCLTQAQGCRHGHPAGPGNCCHQGRIFTVPTFLHLHGPQDWVTHPCPSFHGGRRALLPLGIAIGYQWQKPHSVYIRTHKLFLLHTNTWIDRERALKMHEKTSTDGNEGITVSKMPLPL